MNVVEYQWLIFFNDVFLFLLTLKDFLQVMSLLYSNLFMIIFNLMFDLRCFTVLLQLKKESQQAVN